MLINFYVQSPSLPCCKSHKPERLIELQSRWHKRYGFVQICGCWESRLYGAHVPPKTNFQTPNTQISAECQNKIGVKNSNGDISFILA
jgi:hypothetical protein